MMKSSSGLELVRLQRAFPDRRIFLPGLSVFSNSSTLAPSSAARAAAIMPLAPAPIIITFLIYNRELKKSNNTFKIRQARMAIRLSFNVDSEMNVLSIQMGELW